MKLFKDTNNEVFAYELDGSQDHLIGNKTPITQEEADALIAEKQVIIPAPTSLTPSEKLELVGLTVDELKSLLGVQ
jgi:hypothetical protein